MFLQNTNEIFTGHVVFLAPENVGNIYLCFKIYSVSLVSRTIQ